MKGRWRKIAALCVLGVMIGTVAAWTQAREAGIAGIVAGMEPAAGETHSPMALGGAFSLIDQDGRAVTEKSWPGAYRLIYFGFTYCPEICPTELQKMAATLAALGAEAENIQPLFVTTDPDRDTPPVLKDYVALYHPRLVGLTGTAEQIAAMEAAYKVYAAEISDSDAPGGYSINHSAFTFFMSPDDKPLALFSTDDAPAARAAAIRRVLGEQKDGQ